jgi:predicted metal-dependent phosphoesterase TrpH
MPGLDLHMHSNYSLDGEMPVEVLVEMAAKAGLEFAAVSDHNRTDAVPEALRAGERFGVKVIPAIEIDSEFHGVNAHILGYGIDYADTVYDELWNEVETDELRATGERLELVRSLGIELDMDMLEAGARNGVVVAELIAEVALADPRNNDNPHLAPFRPGGTRSINPYVNFYWDFCSPGRPAYVKMNFRQLPDVVDLIVGTGGTPILAHPGISLKGREDLLTEILAAGVRGVEAFSSYHDARQSAHWLEKVREHGVAFTCGSDYHGKTKPAIRIGGHGGDEHWEKVADFIHVL